MLESRENSVDDINIIMQAEIFQRFISLVEEIRPQLREDGANFNLWSKNMITAWTTYFMGDSDYFQQTCVDSNIKRNLVARLFIEHSVSNNAYESVTSQIFDSSAQRIYQALRDRFNCPSWSSVVYHANIIFNSSLDHSRNINNYAMSITESVHNLENQLGKIDSEMITIQISTALPTFDHRTEVAKINAASRFGRKESHPAHNSNILNKNFHRPPMLSSSRVASSSFPCHYCSEVGHWSPNCPIKAKANEATTKARHKRANVAGIGVVSTLEASEALLDSGATHSVVGNILLFTSLTSTDMTLSVASSKSFQVNAIGTVGFYTSCGLL
ncbi:hypothetical protein O181_040908 [Austropuccinia psidii MF-1]|uniref:CCHC-type domain-containing protein n=1 Tax=Austropuccinia psidii MF-1 TaxID=1389203 RepID=A0A9Q3DI57_9BASI|nr:hypothetical protein [Austropuccinia psidii MF-1]